MSVGLEGADDPGLLDRVDLGEDRRTGGQRAQFGVVEGVGLGAEDHGPDVDADVRADPGGDEVVVAGDDLHRDALVGQGLQGPGGVGLRRVEEGEEAHQGQPVLVGDGVGLARGVEGAGGDGEDAQAPAVVVLGDPGDVPAQLLGQLHLLAAVGHVRAEVQDLLDRTLGDHDVFAGAGAAHERVAGQDHGHPAPGEVEGDLVDHREPCVDDNLLGLGDAVDDRPVHQVAQAGLEVRVEVAVLQDLVVLVAVHVQVAAQDDPVLGEGAGLVGAEHVHRAQVLDRVEPLDDHLVPGHGDGAARQVGGDDHREHLGGQADGDGDAEEEGLVPVALGQAVDHEDDRDHDQHEADQQEADLAHAGVEVGLRALADQRAGHRAEPGVGAGGDDDAGGGAGGDRGPHQGQVVGLDRVGGGLLSRVLGAGVGLGDRQGLAGERGLADHQVLRGEEPQVGRDQVAGGQLDHVARDHLVHGHLEGGGCGAAAGPALHRAGGGHELPQGVGGAAGAVLLPEAQQPADPHHHGQDDDARVRGVLPVHDGGQEDQDGDEGVPEGLRQLDVPARGALLGDDVGAVALQAQRGLGVGEAGRGRVHALQGPYARAGAEAGEALADEPGTGLQLGGPALAAGPARRRELGRGTGGEHGHGTYLLPRFRAARSRTVTWSDQMAACGGRAGRRQRRRRVKTHAGRSRPVMRKGRNEGERSSARGQRETASVRTRGKAGRSAVRRVSRRERCEDFDRDSSRTPPRVALTWQAPGPAGRAAEDRRLSDRNTIRWAAPSPFRPVGPFRLASAS